MTVTLQDVARAAGVHPSTVSRTLSRPELVNARTRDAVEDAVQRLGYVPNRAARRLAGGRTSTIAVLVPDVTNPFFAGIVRGADTDDRALTPESAGLYAAATGFQATSRDDFDNMSRQFPMYEALYEYARLQTASVPPEPRVVFVCLHGAAKSVVAAAHFRRLAAARGLRCRLPRGA